MHTAGTLGEGSFAWTVDGRPARLRDALPGFSADDRVAVVAREPLGALGAATLLLAAVTAFYAEVRAADPEGFAAALAADECLAYPDDFVLHAGAPTGVHGWLEIWPEHKEVVVADEPEALVRALTDRAVSCLLVPDAPPAADGLAPFTRAGAARTVRACLVYAPDGRARGGDVEVAGDDAVEAVVEGAIARSADVAGARVCATARARRAALAGRARFRRVTLEDALKRLAGGCAGRAGG